MISAASVVAIHTASTRAGLTDPEYRALLARIGAGYGLTVHSCKDLPQNLVGEVIDEIKRNAVKRKGWQEGQIATARKYQILAGMDDQDLRIDGAAGDAGGRGCRGGEGCMAVKLRPLLLARQK